MRWARFQKRSCAAVRLPAARACSSATAPGSAPGLRKKHLQMVVEHDDFLGALARAALVAGDLAASVVHAERRAAEADVAG